MDEVTYPERDRIRRCMDLDTAELIISLALETIKGEAFIYKNKKEEK